MKKILFLLLIIFTYGLASNWCQGFQLGYKEGYCFQRFGCIQPISPLCPIPPMGQYSYMDGYHIGFLRGLANRPN